MAKRTTTASQRGGTAGGISIGKFGSSITAEVARKAQNAFYEKLRRTQRNEAKRRATEEKRRMSKEGRFFFPEYFSGIVSLAFIYNNELTPIPTEQITYIMQDDEYESAVVPVVYLSLSVNNQLYKDIMDHQDKAQFFLHIVSNNPLIGSSLSSAMVSQLFNYVTTESNPNYFEQLGTFIATEDTSYRRILVGLVSDSMTTFTRRYFNNIYCNIDMSTLITIGMNGLAEKTTLKTKVTAKKKSTKKPKKNPKKENATRTKSKTKSSKGKASKDKKPTSVPGKSQRSTGKTENNKYGVSKDKVKSSSRTSTKPIKVVDNSKNNKGVGKGKKNSKKTTEKYIEEDIIKGIPSNSRPNWKSVISPLKHNTKFKTILVPPMTSRYRLFEFLFNTAPFYDTNFLYFTDFDYSYLLDRSGKAVDAHNNQKNKVIIRIRDVTDTASLFQGIQRNAGSYYMEVNATNTKIVLNNGTDKIANEIVTYDDDTDTEKAELNVKNTSNTAEKIVFSRTKSSLVTKNAMQDGHVLVEVSKNHIDGRIFTVNKSYYIKHYGSYSKYNGNYLLMYKKVIFKNSPDGFILTCVLGFRSQLNLEDFNTDEPKSQAVSESADRTSTAYQYEDYTDDNYDEPEYDEDYDDTADDNNIEDDDYEDVYPDEEIEIMDEEDTIEDDEPDAFEEEEKEDLDSTVDPTYVESDNNTRGDKKKCFGDEGHRSPDDNTYTDTGKKKY